MRAMRNMFAGTVLAAAALYAVTGPEAAAQTVPAPATIPAQQYGIAAKRPVIGAACAFCPWGALADIVKAAMKPEGYDVQICYNCSNADASRIVAGAKVPLPPRPNQTAEGTPPPPNAPVDFGVTSPDQLRSAYLGAGAYQQDGPYKNLRLFALIDQPSYLIVAVKRFSGITDLAQIKERKLPVRIFTSGDAANRILDYYGIAKDALASWGGSINGQAAGANGAAAGGRGAQGGAAPAPGRALPLNTGARATEVRDYDVYIHSSSVLANNPESNIWYQVTQKIDLNFLQMPEDLLAKLASEFYMQRVDLPQAYLAGVERRIPTVARNGQAVYGRVDAPDDFAYAVAKAMDKGKGLLKWAVLPFSYNPDTVWKVEGVPLHSGAARYYGEAGYIK